MEACLPCVRRCSFSRAGKEFGREAEDFLVLDTDPQIWSREASGACVVDGKPVIVFQLAFWLHSLRHRLVFAEHSHR